MNVIQTRNVHAVLPQILSLVQREGVSRSSRNGPVLVLDQPTTICYEKPMERVLFWRDRDAN